MFAEVDPRMFVHVATPNRSLGVDARRWVLVASWNSYETAPGTGFQANAGVRGKELVGASSARRRKPCRPVGPCEPVVGATGAGERNTFAGSFLADTAASSVISSRSEWRQLIP